GAPRSRRHLRCLLLSSKARRHRPGRGLLTCTWTVTHVLAHLLPISPVYTPSGRGIQLVRRLPQVPLHEGDSSSKDDTPRVKSRDASRLHSNFIRASLAVATVCASGPLQQARKNDNTGRIRIMSEHLSVVVQAIRNAFAAPAARSVIVASLVVAGVV